MVKYCAVLNCRNSTVNSGVSFHRFPSNEAVLNEWKLALGNITTHKFSVICSNHFESYCVKLIGKKKCLLPGSIPSRCLGASIQKSNIVKSPKRTVIKSKRKLNFEEPNYVCHDHTYCRSKEDTVSILKNEICVLKNKLGKAQKKIKVLESRLCRSSKSKTKLKFVLQKCKTLSKTQKESVFSTIEGIPKSILERLNKMKGNKISRQKFPQEMRTFALTLNFLSPKAYLYGRKVFQNCLPHPTTISSWYSGIDGNTGINTEALNAIATHIRYHPDLLLSITFDEMSIRKHVDFDGKNNKGFVDLGEGSFTDEVATSVLVFMVVAVNSNWKIPIAYYFINRLSAEEKANILLQVLNKLVAINANIISVTCDGPATHFKLAAILGASLTFPNFNPSFNLNWKRVYFILDNCHMIKLMRNALFGEKTLYDPNGQEINVKYIYYLHDIQKKYGLVLANKLSASHIDYKKQIMKVKLATQTLSSSVADAIDYCRDVLQLPQFINSEATSSFIRYCDRLFDLCNSRNHIAQNYKAPLSNNNKQKWEGFISAAFSYFQNIKTSTGQSAILTRRKTPFVGLLCLLRSILGIYDSHIKVGSLNYLLTYKLSQDHIELFFSSVRSKGGFNNNPSAKQFSAIFKRLLVHHEIKHQYSNCEDSNIPILSVSSKKRVEEEDINYLNFCDTENLDVSELNLSNFIVSISSYIGGYIVKKMVTKLNCNICHNSLFADIDMPENNLIRYKNRGGLISPSADVLKICKIAEKICKEVLVRPPRLKNCLNFFVIQLLRNIDTNVFACLEDHIINDLELTDNHRLWLIKKIGESYFKIRLHHINKIFNLEIQGTNIRKTLTKTILFKNQ